LESTRREAARATIEKRKTKNGKRETNNGKRETRNEERGSLLAVGVRGRWIGPQLLGWMRQKKYGSGAGAKKEEF
jgi:hypothetical protein